MNEVLSEVAQKYGTPAYVYFFDRIAERASLLRDAFGGRFGLSYAVKANPNRALLRKLRPHVAALDVSSGGELALALEAGYAPELLSFSGPAKTTRELEAAVSRRIGDVIVESIDEMEALDRAARAHGVIQSVLLRVNPIKIPRGFGVGMAAHASHFGIDEEELAPAIERALRCDGLRLDGFHLYAGTQCLNADAIVENIANSIGIFRRAAEAHSLEPRRLVFGSSFGIPYDAAAKELDLAKVAAAANPLLDAMKTDARFGATEMRLELGRYLVGQAGIYLTRVIRVKTSRGKRFGICDGGLHHHLAATGHFGSVVRRDYPMFKVGVHEDAATSSHQLVGPLCTTIDLLGADVNVPTIEAGDLIAIESSGAYGLTASPVYFIRHPKPREILVSSEGGSTVIEDVTGEGTPHLSL